MLQRGGKLEYLYLIFEYSYSCSHTTKRKKERKNGRNYKERKEGRKKEREKEEFRRGKNKLSVGLAWIPQRGGKPVYV